MQRAASVQVCNVRGANQDHVTLIFAVKNRVGILQDVLGHFQKHNVDLTRIESRPAKGDSLDYEFFVDFKGPVPDGLQDDLKTSGCEISVLPDPSSPEAGNWFPRKIADLDVIACRVLTAGADLESDHPGFKDQEYRERRKVLAQLAMDHRHGLPIPFATYTDAEVNTWRVVYNRLVDLYPKMACAQFNRVFPLLQANCGYGPDKIPQLNDISTFLQDCTGFRLRPTAGLLSSRDFLNGLAFRVFHSTQYIRHPSCPFYTPEPDVVHELLGHVPLLADPDFADFSQELGLASIGASDDFIKKLATTYWFTVEFGLCYQGTELRAYGAGLLSSFGELEYSLSGKPRILPFEAGVASTTDYPITEYQPTYFAAHSFSDMQRQMRSFAEGQRPFAIRYNAITQSIEVLDAKEKLLRVAQNVSSTLASLIDGLQKM